jgi:hypothetical protein
MHTLTHTEMDKDTDKRLGQATWTLTWTCSMEMGVHHGHGQAAWMPECR